MAAWEFGAGPMPHWAATLFCLPLILAGLFWAPRRMIAAFFAGRRSRSLHGTPGLDRVLDAPLRLARADFALPGKIRAHWSDYGCFAFLVLRAAVVSMGPIVILAGVCMILTAA